MKALYMHYMATVCVHLAITLLCSQTVDRPEYHFRMQHKKKLCFAKTMMPQHVPVCPSVQGEVYKHIVCKHWCKNGQVACIQPCSQSFTEQF